MSGDLRPRAALAGALLGAVAVLVFAAADVFPNAQLTRVAEAIARFF